MFLLLLGVTFLVALSVCFVVTRLFAQPIGRVLNRIVGEDLAKAWATYLTFAIYVVGISGGVHIYHLETVLHQTTDYSLMAPDEPPPCGTVEPEPDIIEPAALTGNRWVLEIYRTVIGTLRSTALVLLLFFVFALIAYVIVRAFEQRKQ